MKKKLLAFIAAMVIALSGCSGAQTPEETATVTETSTPVPTATPTQAPTSTPTPSPAPTASPTPTEPEVDWDYYSKSYTNSLKGYTFGEVCDYFINDEHISSSMLSYYNNSSETITDTNAWIVDSVKFSKNGILLVVSKRPLSDIVRETIIGMTYDKAYEILTKNGATRQSITEDTDTLLGVIKKSNWSVIDAEISESDGVLYAKVKLSHDKKMGESIAKAIGNNIIDKISEKHPFIGGIIEGVVN